MKKKIYLIFVIMIILLNLYLNAQTWSPPKRLTWYTYNARTDSPDIATDSNDGIHIVWSARPANNLSREILYKKSSNGGLNWSKIKRLTWTNLACISPIIKIDSTDVIHLVWIYDTFNDTELLYKRSTDYGQTWSKPIWLTWNSGKPRNPFVSIDASDVIRIVYNDNPTGKTSIYYKESTDHGVNWTYPKRLTWSTSADPAILPDSSGKLHLFFSGMVGLYVDTLNIIYKSSLDGGKTWSAVKKITWSIGCHLRDPLPAADSSTNIYLFYHDDDEMLNYDHFFKKSTDSGSNWSGRKKMSWIKNADQGWCKDVVVDSSGVIHYVFADGNEGVGLHLYYKNSTNNGITWSPTKKLTWNGSYCSHALSLDSNDDLHLIYVNMGNIYYRNTK